MTTPIPLLVGPTGVGKSEVAYHLALKLKAEIISADAFQVFRGLEVGTAQPSLEWQKRVPHHLVGIRDPLASWNAVEFARQASQLLREGREMGKNYLIVGGAGFYLRALVEGAPQGPTSNPEIREMVARKAEELGNEKLHSWLKERDPDSAHRLHVNDVQRVCRALEKTFEQSVQPPDFEPIGNEGVQFIGLERSRENLDRILHERTVKIWEGGIVNEVKGLLGRPLPEDHPLWGAIGYLEAASHLRGELSREEAVEKIYRRTRQYAKRQWTWFKHQHVVDWVNLDDFPDCGSAADFVETKIRR